MSMTEAPQEEWACQQAERAGWYVRKVSWQGRRHAPDKLFAKDGRVVFIEFKKQGKDARVGQSREHNRMREAGLEVHVCDNPLAALRLLGVSYV